MKPSITRSVMSAALGATLAATAGGPVAAADQWWPFEIISAEPDNIENTETIQYEPLVDGAEKAWNLCVLFPHLKDSYWLSVNYGVVEEAKRQGVKATILQAGGYDQLPRQLSQYDDCMASGAEAILVSAISEAGVQAKLNEGMDEDIPQIALANPIIDTPITARITPDFYQKGYQTGELVKSHLGEKGGKAAGFPGPQGSGWAETYMAGFRDSLKEGNVELLAEMYGEPGVAEQLRLVEDALQTYPEMDVIWGGAPTAEAAVGAIVDAGREDTLVVASYENQATLRLVKNGDILAFATEYPVMMGRIAVDLAVRALEGKEHEKVLLVAPGIITKDDVSEIDTTQIFAPEGWRPVFTVE